MVMIDKADKADKAYKRFFTSMIIAFCAVAVRGQYHCDLFWDKSTVLERIFHETE